MAVIENGSLVELTYTLTDASGNVLDGSAEGQPFTYVHGEQQILPALEAALGGKRVGDEAQLTLPPEQAYGVIDPQALTEVPKRSLPPEALVPGTELTAKKKSGEKMFVTVKEVRDETVVINMNHPFAGKTLHFHLRVLQVIPPPQ